MAYSINPNLLKASDFNRMDEQSLISYRQQVIGGIADICSRQLSNED